MDRPRDRRVVGVLRAEAGDELFEGVAVRDDLALRRAPGPDPRAARPTVKIGVALGRCRPLHASLDPHLPLEHRPVEGHRGMRIVGQLPALAALVVRKEAEAAGVETPQEHDAGRGMAVGRGGGERHGLRLWHPGCHGRVVPHRKLPDRVTLDGGLVERTLLVFFAGVGRSGFHGGFHVGFHNGAPSRSVLSDHTVSLDRGDEHRIHHRCIHHDCIWHGRERARVEASSARWSWFDPLPSGCYDAIQASNSLPCRSLPLSFSVRVIPWPRCLSKTR